MGSFTLVDFIRESNRIEGIHREPTPAEIEAHEQLLALDTLTVEAVSAFVATVAPGHVLRNRAGLNVRVGNHVAPAGGLGIGRALAELLESISGGRDEAYVWDDHLAYETLHPFTDGNGRSGRAIWLWQMGGIVGAPLGFLHHFYYQTLADSPGRQSGGRADG